MAHQPRFTDITLATPDQIIDLREPDADFGSQDFFEFAPTVSKDREPWYRQLAQSTAVRYVVYSLIVIIASYGLMLLLAELVMLRPIA